MLFDQVMILAKNKAVVNINNNEECFWAPNQRIKMISEELRDTGIMAV